jgi:serine/threonine protein kinase/formylglycine-generating enzyme required for sulfatase activity
MADTDPTVKIETWGDFEIYFSEVIGEGGMGTVYRGRQISLNRQVAIKVLSTRLSDRDQFIQRFQREGELLGRLADPNILAIYGAGREGERYYIVMELLHGMSVAQDLYRREVYSAEEVLAVARAVGEAIRAAWEHNIIHRDIKPENLFRLVDGRIKVMDYGLARADDSSITGTNEIMGTVKYMSPEQIQGDPATIQTDLYSLGVVLYELATGVQPFTGETTGSILNQHLTAEPVPPRSVNPSIPEDLELLILRCMAKKPEDRYPDPESFLADVRAIESGLKVDAHTVALSRKRKKDSLGVGGWILGLLVAGLTMGGWIWMEKPWRHFMDPPVDPNGSAEQPVDVPPDQPDRPENPAVDPPPHREYQERASEAITNGNWKEAVALLESALRHADERLNAEGRAAIEADLAEARYKEVLLRAEREEELKNIMLARAAYAEALSYREDPAIRAKLDAMDLSLAERDYLTALTNRDWDQADAALAVLAGLTEPPFDVEVRQEYIGIVRQASALRAEKNWAEVEKLLSIMPPDPIVTPLLEEARGMIKDRQAADEIAKKKALAEAMDRVEATWRNADWDGLRAALRDFRERGGDTGIFAPMVKMAEESAKTPEGMVYVPAGPVTVGGDAEFASPVHSVRLDSFFVDRTEVTVAAYAKFLAAGHAACHADEPKDKDHTPDRWKEQQTNPDRPVVGVDWFDAYAYAAWSGKRLPTEAEWEAAASWDAGAASARPYPWGDAFDASLVESGAGTVEVAGSRKGTESWCGAVDLVGNAGEWTDSWFTQYPESSEKDLLMGERCRVVRGQVTEDDPEAESRVFVRKWYFPDYRNRDIGFRCAQDVK